MAPDFMLSMLPLLISTGTAIYTLRNADRVKKLEVESAQRIRLEQRDYDRDSVLKRYRHPLMNATNELQSRIYNICQQSFLQIFAHAGTEREREYGVLSTLFVIAQFFAWDEIIRREIQFIDEPESSNEVSLNQRLIAVRSRWATDSMVKTFRIFSIDQRAIGEGMIERDGSNLSCIGYLEFTRRYLRDPESFPQLRAFASELKHEESEYTRLVAVHGRLIDLLDSLDPTMRHFPAERRERITLNRE